MKATFFQLFRFGVVGTMNTVIDLAVYAGLTRGFDFFEEHYLVAALIAFIISGINSFFWNKQWTFKDTNQYTHRKLIKFYIAAGVALLVNELILWQLVEFELYDILAKLIAGTSAGVINFTLQKFWTFDRVVETTENEYNN